MRAIKPSQQPKRKRTVSTVLIIIICPDKPSASNPAGWSVWIPDRLNQIHSGTKLGFQTKMANFADMYRSGENFNPIWVLSGVLPLLGIGQNRCSQTQSNPLQEHPRVDVLYETIASDFLDPVEKVSPNLGRDLFDGVLWRVAPINEEMSQIRLISSQMGSVTSHMP